jgi:hypothetical protein
MKATCNGSGERPPAAPDSAHSIMAQFESLAVRLRTASEHHAQRCCFGRIEVEGCDRTRIWRYAATWIEEQLQTISEGKEGEVDVSIRE